MNILLTGCNGQLGTEMQLLAKNDNTNRYFFTDVQQLDITDRQQLDSYVADNNINFIVNCAAYTNVDKAEDDEATALLINATATENLGIVAHAHNAQIIHVSTDYVFNGTACIPYRETDCTGPNSAYGRTKLKGENLLRNAAPHAIIIRTAWLYSEYGNNFLKTMLRLGRERELLNVVYDQVGSPTYALDLAAAIMAIIKAEKIVPGIYHFTNEGVCSWYDFTNEIFRLAGINCQLNAIRSEEYPSKVPRPHYSVLDKKKIKTVYNISIPHWTNALDRCLRNMQQ